MCLRSGEVLHGRTKRLRRKEAHIDLHAAANVEADFVVAAGDDVHQRRILRHVGDRLLAAFGGRAGLAGDEDVQIAHRLSSSPQ